MVRQLATVFIAILFIAGGSITAFAYMEHCGTISTDETWQKADNPHVITCNVYIQGGSEDAPATLTLEPGVEVYVNQSYELRIGYGGWGRLLAIGTETQRITFTSNLASPAPGDWASITFYDRSDSQSYVWTSHLEFCDVRYGGYGGHLQNIYVDSASTIIDYCIVEQGEDAGIVARNNGSPVITNSTIRDNGGYGIDYRDTASAESFTGNTVQDNGSYPIRIGADYVRTLGSGNTFSGNNPDKIRVEPDTITTSGTWVDQGIPYFMPGRCYIQHSVNEPVLTLDPGVTLRFAVDTDLLVGYGNPGALKAVGTSEKKITFTSDIEPGFPGDWYGIRFYPNSKGLEEDNRLVNCVIEYAGKSYGSLYLHNTSVKVTRSHFKRSFKHGIYLDDGAFPRDFTRNTIEGSYAEPILIFGDYLRTLGSGNTYLDNEMNEIRVIGDEVATSGIWPDPGIPYHITGDLLIRKSGGSSLITLTPGSTFKFDPNTRLLVGYQYPGGLIARGDPCIPILFTSYRTHTEGVDAESQDANLIASVPGDWERIQFESQTLAESEVTNCIVEYAGSGGSGSIYMNNTNVPITRNVIRNSLNHGIYVASASPDISKNLIADNFGNGIYCVGTGTSPMITNNHIMRNNYGVVAINGAFPTVGGSLMRSNTLENNRYYGVHNNSSAVTVDATYNWWGDASGPSGEGPGSGDACSQYVDYSSFKSYPMAWVEIDDLWTVDPSDGSIKEHFLPGDSIGYRVRYSMENGTDTSKTKVTANGKAKIEKTDMTFQKHVLKGSKKKRSESCYEDFFWDKTISSEASTPQTVRPKLKLKVKGYADSHKGKFWIDAPE